MQQFPCQQWAWQRSAACVSSAADISTVLQRLGSSANDSTSERHHRLAAGVGAGCGIGVGLGAAEVCSRQAAAGSGLMAGNSSGIVVRSNWVTAWQDQ
jgi:hypothetical protein